LQFSSKKNSPNKSQVFKFFVVGIVNTLFGYGVYITIISLGYHYITAIIFSNITGALFNFKSLGSIVFNDPDNSKIWKFITVYLVITLLNYLFVSILNNHGVSTWMAGLICLLPLAASSFILNKFFVFNK
jgi:putative flippase GtrA